MKTVFQHPPETLTGKRYWRSLEELADTPEFRSWLHREFPSGAAELELDGVSRRNFLKTMSASMALAGIGLTSCRRPEAYLVPYTKSVEWVVPGKALLYTTSMPGRLGGTPLIATTFEGRPTKLEGNPLVPSSSGGTDLFTQASVLDLYDPDRARIFMEDGKESSSQKFDEFLTGLQKRLRASGGAATAILLDEQSAPTRDRLIRALQQQFGQLQVYFDEPLSTAQARKATESLFGADIVLRPDFENADVILSLDSDFLGTEQTIQGTRDFSLRRRVNGSADRMNRLYSVENRFTITGGMADHRLRCAASQIPAFAIQLAQKLEGVTGDRVLSGVVGQMKNPGLRFDDRWISECAKDLANRKGRALVMLGHRYPAWVQALVLSINNALGAFGSTIQICNAPSIRGGDLARLVADTRSGRIKSLLILSGNPAYTAPADANWLDVQKAIPEVVRLGYYPDETSVRATWTVPEAHFLESWGDQRATDG
ncbi:MAG: TAT-variant-translocated molybdopterin oxidoreductase, partial [Verrucomicrobia bacterium]|nr:TAT-variant-translocated molybdopterin oxidoreductase [Verrucomicrobiota bacterium]